MIRIEEELERIVKSAAGLHEKIAQSDPSLKLGIVYCQKCCREMKVDSAVCLRRGWPKCCGSTMSLKSQ